MTFKLQHCDTVQDPTTDDLVIRTSRPLFEGTNSLAFATIRPSGGVDRVGPQ